MGGRGSGSGKTNSTTLSEGQKYIKDNFIQELGYEQAIKESIKELNSYGITERDDIYNEEKIGPVLDAGLRPANAELYDEFVDEYGFDYDSYLDFITRRMK